MAQFSEPTRLKRCPRQSLTDVSRAGAFTSVSLFYSLPETLLVNLPHDALRPLKRSNDHAARAGAVPRVEEVFCYLEVTSN